MAAQLTKTASLIRLVSTPRLSAARSELRIAVGAKPHFDRRSRYEPVIDEMARRSAQKKLTVSRPARSAAGRWCDVFEIRDFLIQRVSIYLDPDYAGKDTARYPWIGT